MPKEILIYGEIYSESAAQFLKDMDAALQDSVTVRINSPGGSPECTWGMIAKFAEHTGTKLLKVDGKAYSMGGFFCCYADDVEALDVSQFLFHRAAYPSWFENDPEYFDEATRENLININASLQKAFMNKIDVAALQAIMDGKPELNGAKVKDIFSLDTRIDVVLNSTEAKKIGLINRIVKITPAKAAEMKSMLLAAYSIEPAAKAENLKTQNTMTIEKLKAEHPELYNAIYKAGAKAEKDRIGACLVFIDVDKKMVIEAIEKDEPLSQKQMAELSLKLASSGAVKEIVAENPTAVVTEEVKKEKEKKDADLTAFQAEVKSKLKFA